jgi:GNAT superfamily N-acetyltransferase
MEWVKDGFKISTDKNLLNVTAMHAYLSKESYWAKNISEARIKRACENSLCFGVYNDAKQIGLARVITDYAVHAHISDVYILPAYHSKGLGKWLMACIMQHPDLQQLRRWSLGTKDAHGLYRQFGFTELSKPGNGMEFRNLKVFNEEWLVE